MKISTLKRTQTITVYLNKQDIEKNLPPSDVKLEVSKDKIKIIDIPRHHSLELLARSDSGKYYVMHGFNDDTDRASYRLHIGPEKKLSEAKILRIENLIDGKTTTIDYVLGNLSGKILIPSPIKQQTLWPSDNYNGQTSKMELIQVNKL